MIPLLTNCLQLLDGCELARARKERLRADLQEIKELLLRSPATAAKVEFFAKERMESLYADMQCLNQRRPKASDVYVLIGSAKAILKITRHLAREQQIRAVDVPAPAVSTAGEPTITS